MITKEKYKQLGGQSKETKMENQIDEVVLAGGSTRIPKIREILSEYFEGKNLNLSIDPD